MTAILLAAGKSSRFAASHSTAVSQKLSAQKLLVELPNRHGKCVVEVSAANLLQAVGRVIAITGRDEKLIRVLDDCGCQVIVNDRADQGMGTSIALGVNASLDADGWIIALGDMPYVLPETIALLSATLREPHQIVIPIFRGRRGHPVGFGRFYGDTLSSLHGDTGARSVIDAAIAKNAADLIQINVDDAGIVKDIDVVNDLQ